MKGIWEQRPPLFQLLAVVFLILSSGLIFTFLALGLATWLYDLPIHNVSLLLSGAPGSAQHEALLLTQALGTIGFFAIPALLGGHLLFHNPELKLGTVVPGASLLVGFLLTVGLAFTASGPVDLLLRLSQAVPLPEAWDSYLQQQQVQMEQQYRHFLQMNNFFDFTKVLLVMALIPALCEELLFRGLLQSMFLKWGKHLAVWLSAVLFASIHGQFYAFFSILVLGAALGYLRLWSRSILWPTLLHFLNNAGIVIQVYFFNVAYDNMDPTVPQESYIQGVLLSAAFVVLMVVTYRHFKR